MSIGRATGRVIAVILVAGLVACEAREEPETEMTTDTAAETATGAAGTQELPDTTVEAVWAHLQEQDYQSWDHFPGKGELYGGGEPHGALLTTYVNDAALRGLEGESPVAIPEGGMIVKENYGPDSTLAAVTVMYKVEGFNPEHSDWWFLKRNEDGTVEASHRVEGCRTSPSETRRSVTS